MAIANPRPDQQEILDASYDHRFTVIRAGRRYGKDFLAGRRCAEQANRFWGGRGLNWERERFYWFLAPTKEQAGYARRELVKLLPEKTYKTWKTSRRIMFRDAVIDGRPRPDVLDEDVCTTVDIKSTKDDAIVRGPNLLGLFVSEAAHIPNFEDIWVALRPALALPWKSDPLRLGFAWFYSTPMGQNHFADLCSNGEDASVPNWCHFHRVSEDNPEFDPQEIQDALAEGMSWAMVRQEYYAEILDEGWGALPPWHKVVNPDLILGGYQPGGIYTFGIDLGRARDHTVIIGLRVDVPPPWPLVYYRRLNQMAWPDQATVIASVLRDDFAGATGRIDSTGVGDAVFSMVQEKYGNVVGVNMHAIQTRNAVIERLIGAVEERKIEVPEDFPGSEQLKREWVAFGAKQLPSGKVRYEAKGKQHDDSVFSLALAVDGALNIGQPNIHVIGGTGF